LLLQVLLAGSTAVTPVPEVGVPRSLTLAVRHDTATAHDGDVRSQLGRRIAVNSRMNNLRDGEEFT
jgi:hypothetical protein